MTDTQRFFFIFESIVINFKFSPWSVLLLALVDEIKLKLCIGTEKTCWAILA